MPELAKRIEIVQKGRESIFKIDGQEFPWHISEAGVASSVGREDIPSVTITILAEEVHIDHDSGIRR